MYHLVPIDEEVFFPRRTNSYVELRLIRFTMARFLYERLFLSKPKVHSLPSIV